MYSAEFDTFKQTLTDLCVAVNRPCNDDLVRVFWEDLRPHSLHQVQERCRNLRREGKTKFTSADLRPESKVASTFEPVVSNRDRFERVAQLQLIKFMRLHDTTPAQLPALLQRMHEIAAAARVDPDMQIPDAIAPEQRERLERELGEQLHEILFSAWRKVIGQ